MKNNATIKDKFQAINWNEASKLGLIDKINKQVLHPAGMSITRNVNSGASPCILKNNGGKWAHSDNYETDSFVRDGVATFFDDGEPSLNEKQIDFLICFNSENRSGSAPSKRTINLAYTYFLDKEKWGKVTKGDNAVAPQSKALGKTLARRLIGWHNLMVSWPKNPKEKLQALNAIGKKKVAARVINAVAQHLETDVTMNKAALENGCHMHSVKSALAKIEKFNAAVKEYGEL